MYSQRFHRFAPLLLILIGNTVQADSATTTPSRGDAIAKGDRIILNTDVPIFQLDPNADEKGGTTRACAPWRTQIEIETTPITTTTTTAKSQSGAPAATKTTVSDAVTTTEARAASAGDTVTTNTTTAVTATARIVRVGPSKLRRKIDSWLGIEGAPYEVASGKKDAAGKDIMVPGCRQVPAGMNATVLQGTTYSFKPSDLEGYSTNRFGLAYGVVVVPNKVIIADRSFISSSSVLPYVGYEAWGPGIAGALVLAAGVGTATSSNQASTTPGQSTGAKATFSVATGIVGSIAGVFKVGLLVGVDTQGKHSGFQYQGKPWIGISLGAGTQ
ncbi:MAG: hypothetical protein M3N97_14735 [Pseudomonadota bacterium]|nr:hypothetical protein [Pseudomonadota bacterium]